ncbi:MAG: hypothetical protein ACP5OO_06315 [Chloroflexia bacterium]
MDETQLRFLTTQALYGKDLQERRSAVRQLLQADLSPADIAAIALRLEVAIACQDEYVRSAAAMLLAGLAPILPLSSTLAAGLLSLSRSPEPFAREAALRAILRIHEQGRCLSPADARSLAERLEEARRTESETFALSLFDER